MSVLSAPLCAAAPLLAAVLLAYFSTLSAGLTHYGGISEFLQQIPKM